MLNIKDPDADRLARQLADATGETITGAVTSAVRERLARVTGRQTARGLADELDEIGKRCSALPVLDTRSDDEIIGYDHAGVPR